MSTYVVGGVDLTDAQDRWRLLSATQVGGGLSVRAVESKWPGMDGSHAAPNEAVDAPSLVLELMVRGDDEGEAVTRYQALASLLAPTKDTPIVRKVGSVSQTNVCRGKSSTAPKYYPWAGTLTFTATLRLPGVYWRGESADWSQSNPGNGTEHKVTTLNRATGPVDDAQILITGPVSQPRVTCGDRWVELALSVPANQAARINCDTWTVRLGSGVTYTNNGNGSWQGGKVRTSGGPYLLRLMPSIVGDDPTVTATTVSLSGSDMTSATKLGIRARPSHVA